MYAHKVSLVSSSSSSNAPYCGGQVSLRPDPEPLRYHLAGDSQSDTSSFLSFFDLVLSIGNSSANGEKSSLCESVPVQGADF